MPEVFGISALGIAAGMNIAVLIGWTYTMVQYRRTLDAMARAHFWWQWWAETAIRHGIQIGDDDIEAAHELQPDGGPLIYDQIHAVAPDEDAKRYIDALEASGVTLDRPEDDD